MGDISLLFFLAGANFWAKQAKICTSARSTSAISTCGISTGTMSTSSISTIFSASAVSTSQHYCTSVILGSITQTNVMLFFRFLWLTGNLRCFVAKSNLSKFTLFWLIFFGQKCISAIFITFRISAVSYSSPDASASVSTRKCSGRERPTAQKTRRRRPIIFEFISF